MDVNEATLTARGLMNHHDLRDWELTIADEMDCLGECDYTFTEIRLWRRFIETATYGMVLDVILHEIAHALVGFEAGHGDEWVRMYIEIGGSEQEYGADGFGPMKGLLLPLLRN